MNAFEETDRRVKKKNDKTLSTRLSYTLLGNGSFFEIAREKMLTLSDKAPPIRTLIMRGHV